MTVQTLLIRVPLQRMSFDAAQNEFMFDPRQRGVRWMDMPRGTDG
jgi:hypothetical protein